MQKRRSRHTAFVIILWILNLFVALVLVVVLLVYGVKPAALAAEPEQSGVDPYSPPTAYPTRYYLPTVTPNPRSTQVILSSPTSFVLPYGQRPVVTGFSVSSRPIEIYTFGQGERQRMIVAGIHGGYEWNTIALADQLITYLTENPGAIPSDVTLYILRDLNPDGDARDHAIDGRVNDHGVDLNRNFPINWTSTWDRTGCFDPAPTTSGSGPASEPETRLIMNLDRKSTRLNSSHQ